MLLTSFLNYLRLEKKYSPHTVKAYERDLESFASFCVSEFELNALEKVHYQQIRNWIVHLVNSGLSNRTINRKISSLKSFYKFLLKIEEIPSNPLSKHRSLKVPKKVQVPFSKEEIKAVLTLEEGEKTFETVRDKMIVEIFYATGIRRTELIHLEMGDVDVERGLIKVLGKRNKERLIPMIQTLRESLKEYMKLRTNFNTNQSYLFVTQKGKKMYDTLVYRIINNYFSKVSSKVKKSPHIIRHTFATHLLNEGADLNAVKELLGHSSLASTQIYTHNSLGKLKEVYNNAHPRSN